MSITRFEKCSQTESLGAVLWLLLCLCPATSCHHPTAAAPAHTPQTHAPACKHSTIPRTSRNRGMALQTPSALRSHPVPSPLLLGTVAGSPLLTQTCSPRCTYRISRHRARRAGAGMAGRPQPLPTPTAALRPPQRCPVCPQASSNRFWRKILSWLCRTAYGREGELGGVLQSCSTRRRSPINLPQ